MRFYSFFARFWVNYRVFWGGCLHFLRGDYLTFFILIKKLLSYILGY